MTLNTRLVPAARRSCSPATPCSTASTSASARSTCSLGRDARERARLIDSIGPVWNGNEVWLLGAGGALVAAFPTLYAASFSGFYLALMLVLWLLLLRGIGIEFRHQIHHPLWEDAWDVVFSVASLLLALLFGVALGNVLRGVPFDADGHFRGTFALLLNPLRDSRRRRSSVATLAMHGACWAALKTDGALQTARAAVRLDVLVGVAGAASSAMVAASFFVRPDFTRNFSDAASADGGAAADARRARRRAALHRPRRSGARSCRSSAYIAGILASVAAGLYPTLLPAAAGSAHAGSRHLQRRGAAHSLQTALVVYVVGLTIVTVYLVNIYRVWKGKVGRP